MTTEALNDTQDNFTEETNDVALSNTERNSSEDIATEETTDQTTEQSEQDYSYVPEKFLKDGQPDFENLSKSYTELSSKLGKKGWKAPDSIDEYTYDFENGGEGDEEAVNGFKQEALDQGLSTDQYSWLMGWFEKTTTETVQSNIETAETNLKEAWGNNYDGNLEAARNAWETFASDDMDMDELGNNPTFLKLMAKIGNEVGEDSNLATTAAKSSGITTIEVQELMAAPDYWENKEKQRLVAEYYEAHS